MRRAGRRAVVLAALALVAGALPARAQDVTCDPGDLEVMSLRFTGAQAFDPAVLEAGIVTTPSSWLRRTTGRFGSRQCLAIGRAHV